jgi:hypothetical protein
MRAPRDGCAATQTFGLFIRDCHQALSFAIAAFMSYLRSIACMDAAGIPQVRHAASTAKSSEDGDAVSPCRFVRGTATCGREPPVAVTFVPSTRTSKTLVVPGTPGLLR